ncbi:MAG: hypothetical protein V5A59_14200 [Bacteroidales bacterium]|nr:hypothetical protein [Bacteroidales bacterium]
MRTFFAGVILLTLFTAGCENGGNQIRPSEVGFIMKMNNQTVINFSDIDYYDFSTHMIYLKHDFSYFKEEELHDMDEFTVYADGEKIYSGHTFPGYYSHMPKGPVIHCDPNFYSDYIVPIGFINIIDTLGNPTPDPRGDQRIAAALKRFNQYHEGLKGEIRSVTYMNQYRVKFEFTLTNEDSFNYYYLDPDKMGVKLFHYFTNGLYISDEATHESYAHKMKVESPESYKTWKKEWLSLIKSGETKTFTITYNRFEVVPTGMYTARFTFPGLHWVDKEELKQDQGRIWLGKISFQKEIIVQ